MLKVKSQLVGKVKSKLSTKGKLNNTVVYVKPSLENLEVTPTKEQQTFNHENSYGYDNVTINPIPEEYIIPNGTKDINSNGTHNVNEYENVNVNVEVQPLLQDKEVTINESGTQNIVADEGYDGLNQVSVTVNAKYSPQHITFYEFTGNSLDYELSNLDTSNITNMKNMFYYVRYVKNLDVTNFNTSNVINMGSMFYNCMNLESLDLSNFDFSKVTTITSMFEGCTYLKSVKFGNHNNELLTHLNKMFYECRSLTEIDLSGFKLNNIQSLYCLFHSCTKLEKLNLSGLDTTNVTSTVNMFYNCPLKTLIIDNPVMFKITTTNTFQSSGIEKGTCTIYVPDDLVETYKADTYWGVYSSQIKGMSEYTG